MKLVLPTLLGMEALVAEEIREQEFNEEQICVRDGQVFVDVGEDPQIWSKSIARLNLWCGCGERVEFELLSAESITDFDLLYECVRKFPWQEWIPSGWAYVIAGGYSRKSKLFGIPACQRIIKKAISASLVESMGLVTGGFVPEDEAKGVLRFQFSFREDQFSLRLDLTGTGLHKRGYRTEAGGAPLKETLAAALIRLTKFQPFREEALWDPFCGSGTLLIEAARWATKTAPGLHRSFSSETIPWLEPSAFVEERERAEALRDLSLTDECFFYGSDVDPAMIRVAQHNARRAGVDDFIRFSIRDALSLQPQALFEETGLRFLTFVLNPPYGERMLDEDEAHRLLVQFARPFFGREGLVPGVRMHIYSSDPLVEEGIGFRADKRRKLYNGMLPCQYYQYFRKTSRSICRQANAQKGRSKRR